MVRAVDRRVAVLINLVGKCLQGGTFRIEARKVGLTPPVTLSCDAVPSSFRRRFEIPPLLLSPSVPGKLEIF